MTQFSGYLMARAEATDVPRDLLELSAPLARGGPTLKFVSTAYATSRWDEFVLSSPIRLADESEATVAPFEYQIFIVRGLGKFVILAQRRKVADYVIQQILDRKIFPNFRRAPINIQKLIQRCETPDAEFLITSLHGRFSAAGPSLRIMSLYGDDVTDSPVFKQHGKLFNFFACGLGRRLFEGLPRLRPNEEGEISRLANDGFLTMNLTDRRRATEFMVAINFVLRNRCVDSWVPIAEMSD